MSVSRDTSGDDMARALSALARTPEAAESGARERLWSARAEITRTIEDLLRIANYHGKSQRLSWREREMTREAQQRATVMLAKLTDIQTLAASASTQAQAASPGGEAGRR